MHSPAVVWLLCLPEEENGVHWNMSRKTPIGVLHYRILQETLLMEE